MIRALYSAASGLVAQTTRQDVIANNIANAQTQGFKRSDVVISSFAHALRTVQASFRGVEASYPDAVANPVVVSAESALDSSPSQIHSTGNPLELAIEGPGALEAVAPDGTRQIRSGRFVVDAQGELSTTDGGKLQGQSGPIKLPQSEWSVRPDGTITSAAGVVDKLKLLGAQDGKTFVRQGVAEESNVRVISEMVEMIVALRSFEANQRVITSVDHTLDKLVNEAGRV